MEVRWAELGWDRPGPRAGSAPPRATPFSSSPAAWFSTLLNIHHSAFIIPHCLTKITTISGCIYLDTSFLTA